MLFLGIKMSLLHIKERLQGKIPSGSKRSSKWPKVRAQHLKEFPKCAVCGGNKKLEVHHVEPFHINADLELDPTNLMTLCESKKGGLTCHLAIGHLGNYRRVNKKVREDVLYWSDRLNK